MSFRTAATILDYDNQGLRPAGRTHLSSLPPELIEEILQFLTWKDLLRVRVTCKTLEQASRSLHLWRNIFLFFIAQTNSPSTYLEEPLESYSASELEQWLLRRWSVEDGWKSANQFPARTRPIPHDQPYLTTLLMPGGRWLLTSTAGSGSVTVYDLDGPQIKNKLLITAHEDLDDVDIQNMAFCAVDQNPKLAFDLALIQDTRSSLDRDSFPASKLCLWRVTLHGHGIAAELEADHLHSFNTCVQGETTAVFLQGDLFGRAILTEWGFSKVEVFDWKNCNNFVHRIATFEIQLRNTPEAIMLLPGKQVLLVTKTGIFIYEIPEFCNVSAALRDTTDQDYFQRVCNPPGYPSPLLVVALPKTVSFPAVSPPQYCLGHIISFVVATDKGIYSVAVSHSPAESTLPQIDIQRMLEDLEASRCNISLGVRRAFCHRLSKLQALTYAQTDDDDDEILPDIKDRWKPEGCPGWASPIMDEDSGRVIIQDSSESYLVMDYALYYRSW